MFDIDKAIKLIKQFTIVTKEGKTDSLSLWSEQVQIVKSILLGLSTLILKPRQIGSSTSVIAALFFLLLFSTEPIHIVILSHKQIASKELLDKAKVMYEGLPPQLKEWFPAKITSTCIKMEKSGARMTAKGAKDKGGIRSFSCTHLLLSEYAFTENPDELLATALSAVNKGQLIIESTANYYDDAFHQLIKKTIDGDTDWNFLFFKWTEHNEYQIDAPSGLQLNSEEQGRGLTPAQAHWFRTQCARLGEAKTRREYPFSLEEAYSQLDGAFIEDQYLQKVKSHKQEPNRIWTIQEPLLNTRYVIGVDPAFGTSGDYSSIHVVDCRTMDVVAGYRSNTAPIPKLVDTIIMLSEKYGKGSPSDKATVNIEGNSEGILAVKGLMDAGIPVYLVDNKPWKTTSKNKAWLLEAVRESTMNNALKNIDSFTYNEMRSIQIDNIGRLDIPRNLNSHADGIMSLGLALYCAKNVSIPKPNVVRGPFTFEMSKMRRRRR